MAATTVIPFSDPSPLPPSIYWDTSFLLSYTAAQIKTKHSRNLSQDEKDALAFAGKLWASRSTVASLISDLVVFEYAHFWVFKTLLRWIKKNHGERYGHILDAGQRIRTWKTDCPAEYEERIRGACEMIQYLEEVLSKKFPMCVCPYQKEDPEKIKATAVAIIKTERVDAYDAWHCALASAAGCPAIASLDGGFPRIPGLILYRP